MKCCLTRVLAGPGLVGLLWLSGAPASAQNPASPAAPARPRSEYLRFALTHEGDAGRGQALFLNEARLACGRCHSTDGLGTKVGPDLFAIGDKFGRREIIESILTPSAAIAEGYASLIVETRKGEEIQGVVREVTGDWIELIGADARRVRVENREIRSQRPGTLSLMPEGLAEGLSPEEFTDLVEYLVSLKQPASADRLHRGMPAEIQVLSRPVVLRPWHGEEWKFEHPVWFGPFPGATNVFLVVEHETGKAWRLEERGAAFTKTLFVDLGPNDRGSRGWIGFVFHPKFPVDRRYFVAQATAVNGRFATIISERSVAPDLQADSGAPSRRILTLEASTGVHYGGSLEFGPDGFLYVGMGDTGPQEDPAGQAQNLSLLRGKIMRLDVDHRAEGGAYSIPPDNPFVGRNDARPEIWAYGLREPWRISFDPLTRELWVGDVGQDRYEEVDLVRRGENFGWNIFEGFERFSNRYRKENAEYVPPVFAYARKFGPSITGGYVYRGNRQSSFYGVYIFGDYESRRVFGLTQKDRLLQEVRQIGVAPQRIVSFGRDPAGELFLVGYEGTIYRVDLDPARFE